MPTNEELTRGIDRLVTQQERFNAVITRSTHNDHLRLLAHEQLWTDLRAEIETERTARIAADTAATNERRVIRNQQRIILAVVVCVVLLFIIMALLSLR